MYALNAMGRLDEALQIGEDLIADQDVLGGRPGEPGRDLYDRADAHLYVAKRSGRDQLAAAAA